VEENAFGIFNAPEVWQQKMNTIVEGLRGVKVITNDFLICGFGTSKEETTANNDTNYLDQLNPEKDKLRLSSVTFTGHLLIHKGDWLQTPTRYQVLSTCLNPSMSNYYSSFWEYLLKFLPKLSVVTEPLCQLSHKDANWDWFP